MKTYDLEAVEYIAKLADGGLRDSLSLLDKCLAYSTELTLENVVNTLGTVDYKIMMELTEEIIIQKDGWQIKVLEIIDQIHSAGKDIKQFIRSYTHFLLDAEKLEITQDWKYISIPKLPEYEEWFKQRLDCRPLLKRMMNLNSEVKYSATAKLDLEASLLMYEGEE